MQNCLGFFYYFNIEINYDVLKSKSPCIWLNKNTNFHKNETKSKMEYPTNSFSETNLVLQLIKESQIKCKTVMSWSSWKKKEVIFCTVYSAQRKFFNICVLSQCIAYWIHCQNIHVFTYQKVLFHRFFAKVFSVFLNKGLLWPLWKENVIMRKNFFCKMKSLLRLIFGVSCDAKKPFKMFIQYETLGLD